MTKKHSISFVIPVYKSEKSLTLVIDQISRLKNLDWEVVLVNDNSPDDVKQIILKLINKYSKRIVYLEFRKNYGQHTAIIEGFKHVTKEYVATIDDDGQNPPEEVLKMMKLLLKYDYDVVYGIFKEKQHSFFRNIISVINRYVSMITINNKNKIPISNVRLLKNYFAISIANASSNYNYVDGLIFSLTDHIGFTFIINKSRQYGKSTYGFIGLIKLWINHIIGYSNVMIKIVSFFSFFIATLAFLTGLIYLFLTINNAGRPSGWLSIYVTITLLSSMLFLILGILAEYIGRMYVKINQNSKKIINKNFINEFDKK